MSFCFLDLCQRTDADYALLQQRTDACAKLGRSYELRCTMPPGFLPGEATIGFCRTGDRYFLYIRPRISCKKEIPALSGLLAQGIGTSMLQVPNIVKKPIIWLPAILSSAVLGPVGTMLLSMTNNATGSGMGTAGLVGQIMTYQTMVATEAPILVLGKILLIQIVLPAIVTLLISEFMRKKKWIKYGDMKLDL